MSTQTIIGAIHKYTENSPIDQIESDALSLTQFALAEAMMELSKAQRLSVVDSVSAEILDRSESRLESTVEAARNVA